MEMLTMECNFRFRYMLGHVLYSNGRTDSLFDFVLDSTDDMDLKMPSISNDVWKGDMMTDQDCIDSLNKLLTYLKGRHHTRAHRYGNDACNVLIKIEETSITILIPWRYKVL